MELLNYVLMQSVFIGPGVTVILLIFAFNPLLHGLFLDHDIISIFRQNWKKKWRNLNTFENIMEKSSICSVFHNILKYMVFQRHQKVLLWSKGLSTS